MNETKMRHDETCDMWNDIQGRAGDMRREEERKAASARRGSVRTDKGEKTMGNKE